MYKYRINFLVLLLALSFASCSLVSPSPEEETKKSVSSQKAFEQEDIYILFALRAEQLHENHAASDMFKTLYEKSQKKEYLYRSLENQLVAKEYTVVVQRVDFHTQGSLDDYTLIRLKVIALVELGKLEEARVLSVSLVKKSQEEDDYILVSDVYIKMQKYDMALKYLESGYNKNYSEKLLDKLSIVMYVNLHRKKDAIAQLETHTRINGCSKMICSRLLAFYSNENNIDGILSTYLRMYAIDKDEEIAKKIIQIYGYKQDNLSLITFLEDSHSNDRVLLQLYSVTKSYKKAKELSDKLYDETGTIGYLGQSAIYEYEAAKKRDKKLLSSVTKKLERVVEEDKNPLYLNYLGYVLIDHNIDVKRGVKYIKEVLKIQPNSAYYLDSLAWGYYKLGKCSKAKLIMNKVVALEGGDDEEVLNHVKAINKCLKTKKRKVKKRK